MAFGGPRFWERCLPTTLNTVIFCVYETRYLALSRPCLLPESVACVGTMCIGSWIAWPDDLTSRESRPPRRRSWVGSEML
ncbi:MAG: hypothetical protein EWM72_03239 [Nitrospira sp.]|nr:MAG: hypothetical protein EWM72_03239 [Nitrospira sp.]